MKIKTTMRDHLTPARMAIIKNPQTINVGEGVERRQSSHNVGGDVNWYSHYEEQHGGSLKNLQLELPYDSVPLRHVSGEKHDPKGYTHPSVHCSSICNTQDVEAI